MAELKIPDIGESITEVQIAAWLKAENDPVTSGEPLVTIESEKASLDLPAPSGGRLVKILKQKGETVKIGTVIAQIGPGENESPPAETKPAETSAPKPGGPPPGKPAEAKPVEARPAPMEAAASAAPSKSKPANGGATSTPAESIPEAQKAPAPAHPKDAEPAPTKAEPCDENREEEVVPMSPLRRTAARRLLEAQHTAALLTTFNEADLTSVIALRKDLSGVFAQKHGVKLGFMSFFVKASIDGLKQAPHLNAEIRGTDIVFRNYYDIGVAINSGRGLVVPVLRNAEQMSFAEIEKAISDMKTRADNGKLMPAEISGGTFTITNGGVFGSLLSTPIVNPPQSGVLGMHAIQDRPVAVAGQVVIRPMMYLALTYDHRIVDGREAVTFLKRLKEAIENPARMLIEV